MITFTLIALILLGICYIIFKDKTFGSKRITSVLIVAIGTLILYTVASGIISKKYPLERVIYDTEVLHELTSSINDSTVIKAAIGYDFKKQRVYTKVDDSYDGNIMNVKFLSKYDTIPKFIITQYERQIDSYLWIAPWGIPYQNREYTVYIPNDTNNKKIVSLIIDNLSKSKDEETI